MWYLNKQTNKIFLEDVKFPLEHQKHEALRFTAVLLSVITEECGREANIFYFLHFCSDPSPTLLNICVSEEASTSFSEHCVDLKKQKEKTLSEIKFFKTIFPLFCS